MKMKLRYLLAGLMTAIISVPTLADPVERNIAPELTVPKALKLLQSQGYHDFRKIKVEREDHEIEVEARNADGHRVEIELDLFSGKIIDIERD